MSACHVITLAIDKGIGSHPDSLRGNLILAIYYVSCGYKLFDFFYLKLNINSIDKNWLHDV